MVSPSFHSTEDTKAAKKAKIRTASTASEAAYEALNAYTGQLLRYVELAAQHGPDTEEHIHQLRVYTRRTAAALGLYARFVPKKRRTRLEKRLKRLRRAAGEARDLDVLLSRATASGAADLVLQEIRNQRANVQEAVASACVEALGKYRLEEEIEALLACKDARVKKKTKNTSFSAFAQSELESSTVTFFEAWISTTSDLDALHAFRIRAKTYRYGLELLSPAFSEKLAEEVLASMKHLQDLLGGINDRVSAVTRIEHWQRNHAGTDLVPVFEAELKRERRELSEVLRHLDASLNERKAELYAAVNALLAAARPADLEDDLSLEPEIDARREPEVDAAREPAVDVAREPEVEAVPDGERDMVASEIEVERKFLLLNPPPDSLLKKARRITQIYPSWPGDVRVREVDGQMVLTIKTGAGLARRQWESRVPAWVFEMFDSADKAHTHRIQKTRYVVRHSNHRLEVDQFEGELEGLWILECEFKNAASAARFELPDWAQDAVEVTADPRFQSRALAQHGRPS